MVAAHVLATLVIAVLADAVFAVAEAPSSVLPRAPLHPCSPCLSRRNHDHDLGPGRRSSSPPRGRGAAGLPDVVDVLLGVRARRGSTGTG
jgi:hypothetical protein